MNVKGLVSIFTYGFEKAKQNFENINSEYISLCDYETLLPQVFKNKLYYRIRTPSITRMEKRSFCMEKINYDNI